MPSFLNLSLDRKINTNFLFKHILFSTFWIVAILIFIFRLDVVIIEKYSTSLSWLKVSIPTIYFLTLVFYFFFIKWYYIIGFFFYPFLMIFWFLPKTVLSVGKVYLFGTYISSIFARLVNFKLFILNVFLFLFSFILLTTIGSNWTRWVAIFTMSYFFLAFVYKFIKKSFKQPAIFGTDIEEKIKSFVENKNPEKSLVITSYVIQKDDEKLQLGERRETQIRRTILANYALELLTKRLSGHRGKQAYMVSLIFGALIFLLTSTIFFWFLNFQLFKVNNLNFIYKGTFPSFDFLYYTFKTITFGDIELIKPNSVLARISETTSFLTIGIFALVVIVSIILSLKQDKMNENVKLTTDMFNSETLTLSKYMQDEFGMEIKTAMSEIKNIDTSLHNLKSFIDKIL